MFLRMWLVTPGCFQCIFTVPVTNDQRLSHTIYSVLKGSNLNSSLHLIFALFCPWCAYWNFLYNHSEALHWNICPPFSMVGFSDHGVLSVPLFILYAAVITVGVGVCWHAWCFLVWFLVFLVVHFLTVLANVMSSTGSPTNMSTLDTNCDEAQCVVIHQVSYWLATLGNFAPWLLCCQIYI